VALTGDHLTGIGHDLVSVLVIPGFPVTLIGLLVLPWVGRRRAIRPLVLAATFTFVVTSLAFPVATLSGTYLHAAGAAFVLLSICCLVAVDGFVAWVGRLRGWTRPVAWLGPAFALAAIAPLCVLSVSSLSNQAGGVQARYDALPAAMARAGVPLDGAKPVITDNPIWLAEAARVPTLALPEEPPDAVLDLARHFGAALLVVRAGTGREWPDILNSGGNAASCFVEVPLTEISGSRPLQGSPLASIHVFRIVCP
jgi:nucleotide-binding universal stress UspA family protein